MEFKHANGVFIYSTSLKNTLGDSEGCFACPMEIMPFRLISDRKFKSLLQLERQPNKVGEIQGFLNTIINLLVHLERMY